MTWAFLLDQFATQFGLWWVIWPAILLGIVVGILPGFSPQNTLIMLLPLTLGIPVEQAFAFMVSLYCANHLAGGVPAILVKIPGSGGAAATTLDGYPMTQKGQAQQAIVHGPDEARLAREHGRPGAAACIQRRHHGNPLVREQTRDRGRDRRRDDPADTFGVLADPPSALDLDLAIVKHRHIRFDAATGTVVTRRRLKRPTCGRAGITTKTPQIARAVCATPGCHRWRGPESSTVTSG